MRDTIEMAREADEYADMEWPLRPRGEGWQKCRDVRFETLVRADEREACAKVCDDLPAPDVYSDTDKSMWDVTCVDCAEAIRARGETK
jgi:hypothetical protein